MRHCLLTLFSKTNALKIKQLPKRALQTLGIEVKVHKQKIRLVCSAVIYCIMIRKKEDFVNLLFCD